MTAKNNSVSRILRGVFIYRRESKHASNRMCHLQSRNQIESGIQENRRLHRRLLLFAIGNRKSKIENVVVPVVQRIERRFPKTLNVGSIPAGDNECQMFRSDPAVSS